MPKIRVSEYLLNKYGVRLKNIPAGLTKDEYDKAVVEAMRTCIPQLADNFILSEDETVDSMIAKLKLIDENPSMNGTNAYHTKFKVFMNRYTYDYANCPAAPKKITMQIRDTSKFLYDNKYADNRTGVYKLVATIGRRPTSYNVTYTYYSVNADGPIDGTFKTSTDATLVWEPLNRRFEITIGAGTKAKFLQDTEYDVVIDWCGSNFINFEEPAYTGDNLSNDLDSYTKYDRICEHPEVTSWVQKYSDNLFTLYDVSRNLSIVTDNLESIDFSLLDVATYIHDTDYLILSNLISNNLTDLNYLDAIQISNVRNVILINCDPLILQISNCENVTIIDHNASSFLMAGDCNNIKVSNLTYDSDNLIEELFDNRIVSSVGLHAVNELVVNNIKVNVNIKDTTTIEGNPVMFGFNNTISIDNAIAVANISVNDNFYPLELISLDDLFSYNLNDVKFVYLDGVECVDESFSTFTNRSQLNRFNPPDFNQVLKLLKEARNKL